MSRIKRYMEEQGMFEPSQEEKAQAVEEMYKEADRELEKQGAKRLASIILDIVMEPSSGGMLFRRETHTELLNRVVIYCHAILRSK